MYIFGSQKFSWTSRKYDSVFLSHHFHRVVIIYPTPSALLPTVPTGAGRRLDTAPARRPREWRLYLPASHPRASSPSPRRHPAPPHALLLVAPLDKSIICIRSDSPHRSLLFPFSLPCYISPFALAQLTPSTPPPPHCAITYAVHGAVASPSSPPPPASSSPPSPSRPLHSRRRLVVLSIPVASRSPAPSPRHHPRRRRPLHPRRRLAVLSIPAVTSLSASPCHHPSASPSPPPPSPLAAPMDKEKFQYMRSKQN